MLKNIVPSKHSSSHWEDESSSKPRLKKRADYPGGPAAGPGILNKYKEYFTSYVGNKKNAEVLILGATPELRDLALELGAQVYALDISEAMLNQASEIMKYRDHVDEKRLIGNWLEIALENSSVDLVVGDGVTNNIPVGKINDLFTEIKRVLKPGGYVLLRDLVNTQERSFCSVEEIAARSRKEKWHKFDFFYEFYCYTAESYNVKNQSISMDALDHVLQEKIYGRGLLDKDKEDFLKTFIKGPIVSTFITEAEWLENFNKHFHFIESFTTKDYNFCSYHKFFLGQNK